MTAGHEATEAVPREDAVLQLQVSQRTLSRYIADGKLEARKRPNGRILISQESIDAFLAGEPVHREGGAA